VRRCASYMVREKSSNRRRFLYAVVYPKFRPDFIQKLRLFGFEILLVFGAAFFLFYPTTDTTHKVQQWRQRLRRPFVLSGTRRTLSNNKTELVCSVWELSGNVDATSIVCFWTVTAFLLVVGTKKKQKKMIRKMYRSGNRPDVYHIDTDDSGGNRLHFNCPDVQMYSRYVQL